VARDEQIFDPTQIPTQDPYSVDYNPSPLRPDPAALQAVVSGSQLSGPGRVFYPGQMGPPAPGQVMVDPTTTTTQPPLVMPADRSLFGQPQAAGGVPTVTSTTAPGTVQPQRISASKKAGRPTVTEEDIRAGKVPGWTIGPNGYPAISDPNQAQDIKYKWAGGVDDLGGTAPGAKGYGGGGESIQQAEKGYAEATKGIQAPPWKKDATGGGDFPPAPGSQYIHPDQLEAVLRGAMNPIFDQLNTIADRFQGMGAGGQAESLRGQTKQMQSGLPVRSALAYLQNVPTQAKSAQTAATSDLNLSTAEKGGINPTTGTTG
jgi:hypothetical protein